MQVSGPMVVVDDDEDDQGFIRDIFADLNLQNELVFFLNGNTFLNYLRNTAEKPFLILSDIGMQAGLGGLELRAEIQKDAYLRRKSIPFVFFTNSKGTHISTKVFEMQVQGYFLKESGYEALKEQIRLIVDYWKQNVQPYVV